MTETRKTRVSAVILAAGASTRMGRAKQLLPLGETTLLARAIENVRAANLDEIILVLGASAEAIQQRLPPSPVKMVVNPTYGQGMASSLRAGLSCVEASSDAALIVLGDQPFVQPQTLHQLIDGYRKTQAPIVLPS